MRCSVSRSVDDASRDAEWPGIDRRRLTQTTLDGRPPVKRQREVLQPKTAVAATPKEGSKANELSAPLSPSLRASPMPTLPAVEPGQTRLLLAPRAQGNRGGDNPAVLGSK